MRFSISDIVMEVEIHALGTPLVLLHGFPMNHTLWEPVVPHLFPNIQVILPDLRGQGKTSAPEGVYTMGRMAQDIVELLDALKINTAVVAGHSMGGYVALRFAHDHPDRLSGLGLIATQAQPDSPERKQNRMEIADRVVKEGVQSLADSMAPNLTVKPEWVEPLRKMILATAPIGAAGAQRGMANREDARSWLPDFKVPVTVIAPTADTVISPARSLEMHSLIPRAELVQVPGAGHCPMLEYPRIVGEALVGLVRRAEKFPESAA